jgi:CRISPR-associated protein Csx10
VDGLKIERLQVEVAAKSPLCFGERRPGGQFRETTGYVPGAALRAAIAMRLLERTDLPPGVFQDIFVGAAHGPAVFSDACPGVGVLPATAVSCKRHNGFQGDGRHGVKDTLVERLCFEALDPAGPLFLPRCPQCGDRMEAAETRFYRRDGTAFRAAKVTQQLLTRVAINRRRATAEDELLYSPIVIAEGRLDADGNYDETRFNGTVIAGAHGDLLETGLTELRSVGSGNSRGLGQVKISVTRELADRDSELAALQERTQALNEEIRNFWQAVRQLPGCKSPEHGPDTGTYFTLDLQSDAVLKEHGWLPAISLTGETLKELCAVDDSTLRLLRCYSGRDYRGGWNLAWGLPKDVQVVVPRGSVFVFWTKNFEQWKARLLGLEYWGIGERTAEGFGSVRVCDDFHVVASKEDLK